LRQQLIAIAADALCGTIELEYGTSASRMNWVSWPRTNTLSGVEHDGVRNELPHTSKNKKTSNDTLLHRKYRTKIERKTKGT
jgi:hypothetical protein